MLQERSKEKMNKQKVRKVTSFFSIRMLPVVMRILITCFLLFSFGNLQFSNHWRNDDHRLSSLSLHHHLFVNGEIATYSTSFTGGATDALVCHNDLSSSADADCFVAYQGSSGLGSSIWKCGQTFTGACAQVVGKTTARGDSDGTGVAAEIEIVFGMTLIYDSGNWVVFTLERALHKVRRIDTSTWVTTSPYTSYLLYPEGLVSCGSWPIFVADTDHMTIKIIQSWDTQDNWFSGSGAQGSQDGVAGSAQFHHPSSLACYYTTWIFVFERGAPRIRKVAQSDGAVSLIAGDGTAGNQDGTPLSAKFGATCYLSPRSDPNGVLYILDLSNYAIRVLQYVGSPVYTINLGGSICPGSPAPEVFEFTSFPDYHYFLKCEDGSTTNVRDITCSNAGDCNALSSSNPTLLPNLAGPSPTRFCACTCHATTSGDYCQNCATNYENWQSGVGCTKIPCTDVGICNGNADSVSGNLVDGCSCNCYVGYRTPYCDSCADNYGGWPTCVLVACQLSDCNNHATLVTGNLPNCVCTCINNYNVQAYSGTRCNACAANYGPYSSCGPLPCTNAGDCSGNAASTPTGTQVTGCTCSCINNYNVQAFAQPICNDCLTNYENYATCSPKPCTNGGNCNGLATFVSGTLVASDCSCTCIHSYNVRSITGTSCQSCNVNYQYWPACGPIPCTVSGDCNNLASNVVGTQVTGCTCNCYSNYEGSQCERCIHKYTGWPNCRTMTASRSPTLSFPMTLSTSLSYGTASLSRSRLSSTLSPSAMTKTPTFSTSLSISVSLSVTGASKSWSWTYTKSFLPSATLSTSLSLSLSKNSPSLSPSATDASFSPTPSFSSSRSVSKTLSPTFSKTISESLTPTITPPPTPTRTWTYSDTESLTISTTQTTSISVSLTRRTFSRSETISLSVSSSRSSSPEIYCGGSNAARCEALSALCQSSEEGSCYAQDCGYFNDSRSLCSAMGCQVPKAGVCVKPLECREIYDTESCQLMLNCRWNEETNLCRLDNIPCPTQNLQRDCLGERCAWNAAANPRCFKPIVSPGLCRLVQNPVICVTQKCVWLDELEMCEAWDVKCENILPHPSSCPLLPLCYYDPAATPLRCQVLNVSNVLQSTYLQLFAVTANPKRVFPTQKLQVRFLGSALGANNTVFFVNVTTAAQRTSAADICQQQWQTLMKNTNGANENEMGTLNSSFFSKIVTYDFSQLISLVEPIAPSKVGSYALCVVANSSAILGPFAEVVNVTLAPPKIDSCSVSGNPFLEHPFSVHFRLDTKNGAPVDPTSSRIVLINLANQSVVCPNEDEAHYLPVILKESQEDVGASSSSSSSLNLNSNYQEDIDGSVVLTVDLTILEKGNYTLCFMNRALLPVRCPTSFSLEVQNLPPYLDPVIIHRAAKEEIALILGEDIIAFNKLFCRSMTEGNRTSGVALHTVKMPLRFGDGITPYHGAETCAYAIRPTYTQKLQLTTGDSQGMFLVLDVFYVSLQLGDELRIFAAFSEPNELPVTPTCDSYSSSVECRKAACTWDTASGTCQVVYNVIDNCPNSLGSHRLLRVLTFQTFSEVESTTLPMSVLGAMAIVCSPTPNNKGALGVFFSYRIQKTLCSNDCTDSSGTANGVCVKSLDGTNWYCQCNEGYTGGDCSHRSICRGYGLAADILRGGAAGKSRKERFQVQGGKCGMVFQATSQEYASFGIGFLIRYAAADNNKNTNQNQKDRQLEENIVIDAASLWKKMLTFRSSIVVRKGNYQGDIIGNINVNSIQVLVSGSTTSNNVGEYFRTYLEDATSIYLEFEGVETDFFEVEFIALSLLCPGINNILTGYPVRKETEICHGKGTCVKRDYSSASQLYSKLYECQCHVPFARRRFSDSCNRCGFGYREDSFPDCALSTVCALNCSQRGVCIAGVGCQCQQGWYGLECELIDDGNRLGSLRDVLETRIPFSVQRGGNVVSSGTVDRTILTCSLAGSLRPCVADRRSIGQKYLQQVDASATRKIRGVSRKQQQLEADSSILLTEQETTSLSNNRQRQNGNTNFSSVGSIAALNASLTFDVGVAFNTYIPMGEDNSQQESKTLLPSQALPDYILQESTTETAKNIHGELTIALWLRATAESKGFLLAEVDSAFYGDGTCPILHKAWTDMQDRSTALPQLALAYDPLSVHFAIAINGPFKRMDLLISDETKKRNLTTGMSGGGKKEDWLFVRHFRLGKKAADLFDGSWRFFALTINSWNHRKSAQVYIDAETRENNHHFLQCLPFLPKKKLLHSHWSGDSALAVNNAGISLLWGYQFRGSLDELHYYRLALDHASIVFVGGSGDFGYLLLPERVIAALLMALLLLIFTIILVIFLVRWVGGAAARKRHAHRLARKRERFAAQHSKSNPLITFSSVSPKLPSFSPKTKFEQQKTERVEQVKEETFLAENSGMAISMQELEFQTLPSSTRSNSLRLSLIPDDVLENSPFHSSSMEEISQNEDGEVEEMMTKSTHQRRTRQQPEKIVFLETKREEADEEGREQEDDDDTIIVEDLVSPGLENYQQRRVTTLVTATTQTTTTTDGDYDRRRSSFTQGGAMLEEFKQKEQKRRKKLMRRIPNAVQGFLDMKQVYTASDIVVGTVKRRQHLNDNESQRQRRKSSINNPRTLGSHQLQEEEEEEEELMMVTPMDGESGGTSEATTTSTKLLSSALSNYIQWREETERQTLFQAENKDRLRILKHDAPDGLRELIQQREGLDLLSQRLSIALDTLLAEPEHKQRQRLEESEREERNQLKKKLFHVFQKENNTWDHSDGLVAHSDSTYGPSSPSMEQSHLRSTYDDDAVAHQQFALAFHFIEEKYAKEHTSFTATSTPADASNSLPTSAAMMKYGSLREGTKKIRKEEEEKIHGHVLHMDSPMLDEKSEKEKAAEDKVEGKEDVLQDEGAQIRRQRKRSIQIREVRQLATDEFLGVLPTEEGTQPGLEEQRRRETIELMLAMKERGKTRYLSQHQRRGRRRKKENENDRNDAEKQQWSSDDGESCEDSSSSSSFGGPNDENKSKQPHGARSEVVEEEDDDDEKIISKATKIVDDWIKDASNEQKSAMHLLLLDELAEILQKASNIAEEEGEEGKEKKGGETAKNKERAKSSGKHAASAVSKTKTTSVPSTSTSSSSSTVALALTAILSSWQIIAQLATAVHLPDIWVKIWGGFTFFITFDFLPAFGTLLAVVFYFLVSICTLCIVVLLIMRIRMRTQTAEEIATEFEVTLQQRRNELLVGQQQKTEGEEKDAGGGEKTDEGIEQENRKKKKEEEEKNTARKSFWGAKIIFTLSTVLSIVYSPTTYQALVVFFCHPNIICIFDCYVDATHTAMVVVSVFVVVFLSLGVPMFHAYLIHHAVIQYQTYIGTYDSDLLNQYWTNFVLDFNSPFASQYQSLRYAQLYFEVCYLAFRFLMSLALVGLPAGSSIQLAVSICLQCFFTLYSVVALPYLDMLLNQILIGAQFFVSIMLFLRCVQVLAEGSSSGSSLVGIFMVLLTAVALILCVFAIWKLLVGKGGKEEKERT